MKEPPALKQKTKQSTPTIKYGPKFNWENIPIGIAFYFIEGYSGINDFNFCEEFYELTFPQPKESQMNKNIIKLFPITANAVIVEKYFGKQLECPLNAILAEGRDKEILAVANKMQAEEDAKNSK